MPNAFLLLVNSSSFETSVPNDFADISVPCLVADNWDLSQCWDGSQIIDNL